MTNTASSLKRAALAVGGAALLLCATIGLSQAQSATPSKSVGKLRRAELSVAATTLNYPSLQAMRKDLAGTTLTALATSRVGSTTPVANALKADVDARIQAMVTAGTLKAHRATRLEQKAEAKVDALMTRQFKDAKTA